MSFSFGDMHEHIVKINFRPSSSVRPNLTSTRAGDKIEFIDIKAALEGKESEKGGDGDIVDDPTA